ncbi:hypothetical protein HRH25_08330 [Flavisolibacter sp. BT320]|jgi:hypothetical protein|nr:hypothetical protein [Flavisolibacter longurius]
MGLSDFILLGEKEKKWTVLHQGILVGKRENRNRKIFLFQLDDFYVETFCNPQNKSIEEYRVFNDTQFLHPYLSNIPLDDLLN